MSSRLKNIIGAFGVSITLWVVIIHGSISLLDAHHAQIDPVTTSSFH